MSKRPPFRSFLLVLSLCVSLCLWGCVTNMVADSDSDPGSDNPIDNPANLTIFSVDDIGMLASSNTVANTVLLDFAANDAKLTQWSQSGQELKSDDPCVETPRRRLIAGRVSTPKFEQPICVNRFGVSLYTGKQGMSTGNFLAYSFSNPGISGSARDFDANAGLLSWIADSNELLHMDIAVARRDLNNQLALDIIGYRDASKTEKEALVSLAKWRDASDQYVTGDVAVTLGDYDNNGELEILVAADITTGEAGPGKLLLRSFSYAAKTHKLTAESSYTIDTTARPHSISLAAGDFSSLGFDQAILGYYPEGAKSSIELALFRLGDKLEIEPPALQQSVDTIPASGSFFEMLAGLFYFNPQNTQGGDTSYAFHNQQLALAWVESDGSVKARIIRPSSQLTQFEISPAKVLSDSKYPSRTDSVGPALAIGNFIGQQNDNVSPLAQLAVVIPTRGSSTQTSSIPELVVATVSYDNKSNRFSINPAWSDRQPIYVSSGIQYSPGAVGLDSRGMSYYLGTPAHIRVQDLIDPQYVIYMPPRHADCLVQEGDTDCTMVNISADTAFTVELVDSQDSTLRQTTTDQMSTDFGASASASVSGTVGGGIAEIAELEASASVKTTFSYEQQSMERNINTHYEEKRTTNSATTTMDDHLIWNARTVDIWRYPVYGMNLKVSDQHPYYDVLVPGQLSQYSAGGRSVDWFSPRHMNNDLLSYPNISDPEFPRDLGDFSYNDKSGKKVSVREPLNQGVVRAFDGNMQTFELSYTEEVGGSSEKSFSYNLSNSTDVTVGFKASAKIEAVNLSSDIESTLSLNTKASWENSSLSERSVTNSRGITLNQPEVDWISDKSYNYRTLIYITSNGGLKVAHAVDPLGTMGGRGWWKSTYGGLPDPALNLPNRLVYSYDEGMWVLNTGNSYSEMRGIALTSATYDKETESYPYLSGGVEDGDKVRVVVKLYNLSLGKVAEGVKVNFAYQALDPNDLTPVGNQVNFATSQPLDLSLWQVNEIAGVWDTTGLAGNTGTPYRFVISLDTGGMKEIHGNDPQNGGNNSGNWPWSGSAFYVFKRGSKAILATSPTAKDEPRVDVNLLRSQNGSPYIAEVTIQHTHDDPSLRHLLLVEDTNDEDEPRKVVVSRTLWGIPKGERHVRIPLRDLQKPLPKLRAIITSGSK